MNFICGFLLLHCKTEDASFCLFRRIMSHPRMQMENLYKDGFPLLKRLCIAVDELAQRHCPQVHAHLKSLKIDSLMYAQSNLMTLFTYSSDWAAVTPIWTEFMQVGWVAPLKVVLYMMRMNAAALLAADFEGAIDIMREASSSAPLDIMMRANSLVFYGEDMTIIQKVYV